MIVLYCLYIYICIYDIHVYDIEQKSAYEINNKTEALWLSMKEN